VEQVITHPQQVVPTQYHQHLMQVVEVVAQENKDNKVLLADQEVTDLMFLQVYFQQEMEHPDQFLVHHILQVVVQE
jgi:hypothetical protein